MMHDNVINERDIFLQDVVCTMVLKHEQENDFELYNLISEKVDIPDLETARKIFNLIKLNRLAFAG